SCIFFFFSSRRRHTRWPRDWSSDVCSSDLPNGEEHWCAIVIRRGGLNQATPTHPASEFHDNDTGFPIPAGTVVPIANRTERRYRFWGPPMPGDVADGHCINFLVYNGLLYLYDACFGTGPIQIDATLPVNNTNIAQGGA